MNHAPSNPLIGFLEQQKKLSLLVLLNAFQRLSLLQSKQGQFDYHDVVQIFISNLSSNPVDIDSYVRLFYEAALVPAIGFPYNPHCPILQIKRELMGNDHVFSRALLTNLVNTCGGYHHPAIESLEAEVQAYFNPPQAHPYMQTGSTRPIPTHISQLYPPRPEMPVSSTPKIPTTAYYPQQTHLARSNTPTYQTAQPTMQHQSTQLIHRQPSPASYPQPTYQQQQPTYPQPTYQPSYSTTQPQSQPPQAAHYHRQSHLPTSLPSEYAMSQPRSVPSYPAHPSQPPHQPHQLHHQLHQQPPQHQQPPHQQHQHSPPSLHQPSHQPHRQSSSHRHQHNNNFDQLPPQILNAPSLLQAGIEFEKLDPIVRFLAQIRKYGMDVLFPQIIHDKILACIFTAFTVYNRPVIHRELVDMAMYLKDCRLVRELEHVSKTKLRGVLAILKQGDLVMKHGNVGEPVQLSLGEDIHSFTDLRDQHDRFINSYMVENLLNIPMLLKNEIIWPGDEGFRSNRMRELKPLLDQMFKLAQEFMMKQQQAETGKSSDEEDASEHTGRSSSRLTHTPTSSAVNRTPSPAPSSQHSIVSSSTEKGFSPQSQLSFFSKSPQIPVDTFLYTTNKSHTPTLEDTYSNNIFTEERRTTPLTSSSSYHILSSGAFLNGDCMTTENRLSNNGNEHEFAYEQSKRLESLYEDTLATSTATTMLTHAMNDMSFAASLNPDSSTM